MSFMYCPWRMSRDSVRSFSFLQCLCGALDTVESKGGDNNCQRCRLSLSGSHRRPPVSIVYSPEQWSRIKLSQQFYQQSLMKTRIIVMTVVVTIIHVLFWIFYIKYYTEPVSQHLFTKILTDVFVHINNEWEPVTECFDHHSHKVDGACSDFQCDMSG